MVSRGSAFDSAPKACPFIALELDRDRRSERPDYRHRCYAEQVPAPRTIAHQERYCLSPNFSGCPIFQDWALRAAARPVPLPPGYEGRRGPIDARAAAAAAASAAGAEGIASNVAEAQQWPDSMDSASAAAAAAAAESLADDGGTQQLGAFDAPPEPAPGSAPQPSVEPEREPEPHASPVFEAEDAPGAAALGAAGFAAIDPAALSQPELIPSAPLTDDRAPDEPVAAGESDDDHVGDAAVPAFLAARSARPKAPPKADGPITREEVVPSWELTDRYGAQAGGRGESSGSSDGAFPKILTAVAVVIILALGVAAVVLIPGLLNGPGNTPRPTLALASRTPGNTAIAGVESPTIAPATPNVTAEPTVAPTPAATPRVYKVKAGDTLNKIARKFKITLAALLAANPEIGNGDHIEVGQFLVIPPAEVT